jgi:hypothetical protein
MVVEEWRKTSLLHLLARDLNFKDWEVYMYKSADGIPSAAGKAFLAYAKANPSKRIAVLVDEVNANPCHCIFIELLKHAPSNILVVGAAVPKQLPSGTTANFRGLLRSYDLVLRKDDEDVRALIEHWKTHKANEVTPAMVVYVSRFLLDYCGGHTYPVLAFMEHIFARTTRKQAKEFLSSEGAFKKHFYSPQFTANEFSKEVSWRCFLDFREDKEVAKALARVLGGVSQVGDIATLTRLGWWLEKSETILSTLLVNECLLRGIAKAQQLEDVVFLKGIENRQQNLELVITTGLKKLTLGQLNGFDENNPKFPIENALSFNWGSNVMAFVKNAHVEFQRRSGTGWVDFYLNGRVDTALEAIRNATQTKKVNSKKRSTDIDEHMERFTSETEMKYNFKHFALLNFAMEGKKVVLPRDKTHHDKVYTYLHATNALYRGSDIIRHNVVDVVKSIPKAPTTTQRRDYSTMVQSSTVTKERSRRRGGLIPAVSTPEQSGHFDVGMHEEEEEEEEEEEGEEEVQTTRRKRTAAFIRGA